MLVSCPNDPFLAQFRNTVPAVLSYWSNTRATSPATPYPRPLTPHSAGNSFVLLLVSISAPIKQHHVLKLASLYSAPSPPSVRPHSLSKVAGALGARRLTPQERPHAASQRRVTLSPSCHAAHGANHEGTGAMSSWLAPFCRLCRLRTL